MVVHQGLLHGVQLSAAQAREIFHRKKGLAVQGGHEQQAGVEVAQGHRSIRLTLGHRHGAGSAIAFVAAFLGPGTGRVLA